MVSSDKEKNHRLHSPTAIALKKTVLPCLLDETPLTPSLTVFNAIPLKKLEKDFPKVLHSLKKGAEIFTKPPPILPLGEIRKWIPRIFPLLVLIISLLFLASTPKEQLVEIEAISKDFAFRCSPEANQLLIRSLNVVYSLSF